ISSSMNLANQRLSDLANGKSAVAPALWTAPETISSGAVSPRALSLTKRECVPNVVHIMSLDLNSLLKDWPHETGSIKVRKIIGLDGNEKLQLRIDLSILQMEMKGRPDGQRPHNCE